MNKALPAIGVIAALVAFVLSITGHVLIMIFGMPVAVSVIFWIGYRLYRCR